MKFNKKIAISDIKSLEKICEIDPEKTGNSQLLQQTEGVGAPHIHLGLQA